MRWQLWLLIGLLALIPSGNAQGGFNIFGKKEPKVPAVKRVPELIQTIKTSRDDHKRKDAVGELREFDPTVFPDIVPVLVDVLLHDPKSTVRAEAAQTIGKVRPITKMGGWALEKALDDDSSLKVRLYARSALLKYHWLGYSKMKKDNTPLETKEPPMTPPSTVAPPVIDTHQAPIESPARPLPPRAPQLEPLPGGERLPQPTRGRIIPTDAHPLPVGPVELPLSQGVTVPKLAPVPKLPPRNNPSAGPELD